MLRFDEQRLLSRLESIDAASRTLVALLTYGRLSRICRNVLASAPSGAIGVIERIEAGLWDLVGDAKVPVHSMASELEQLDELLKIVNDDPRRVSVFAEDAIAALSYSLRACTSGDAQEAAWAMRRAYETFDQFAIWRSSLPQSPVAERQLLDDPAIQDELQRQERDLSKLEGWAGVLTKEFVRQCREQSDLEAIAVANLLVTAQ